MKDLPILMVEGKNIAETWEKAVIETWNNGIDIKTEYDRPEDPPSKDCTMIMVIHQPLSEPRIHRAFPAGLEDLEIYRQEVVDGVHDHWINPKEGKWTYTYHQRLFSYKMADITVNQIEYIINKLADKFYSRRAQAITWNPIIDPKTDDPPCLQRIWFRIIEAGDAYLLDMNSHWRSRDAYKAAFMNIFALTDLQNKIAIEISNRTKKNISAGRYVDISDSFHIYGSYHLDFQRFLDTIKTRTFEERTWDTSFAETFFEEAREKLRKERKL